MAKTKIIQYEDLIDTDYYAYFDPLTDTILSVTNVRQSDFTHYAPITKDIHADLVSGKLSFDDCIIDRIIDSSGNIEFKLITKQIFEEYNYRSLSWVKDSVTDSTEFVVEWNKNEWIFYVTDIGRKSISGAQYDSTLLFFVILETDFDFLLRTISIRIHDVLKAGKINYNFESNIESNIKEISVATKSFFKNYGLKIND
jgi:hypothetical protein